MSDQPLAPGSPYSPGGGTLGRAWAAVHFGWTVAYEAVRDFVWADLREGVLDLRGLGSATRALIWLGFGLLLLVIVAILQGDAWRQTFPLVPLTQGIPGRGRLVPAAVIPVSFFLLSLAWAFLLAGALRSHPAIRLGILTIWGINVAGAMFSTTLTSSLDSAIGFAVGVLSLLAVVVAMIVFSFTRPRRVLELLVLLVLVGTNNAVTQVQGIQSWQASGMPLMVMRLSFEMVGLGMIIIPLLLLVGMDVAAFAFRSAGWVTGIAEERLPRWAPWVLLAGLLGWRLWEISQDVTEKLTDGPLSLQVVAYAGGLSVVLVVGLVWLAVRALAPRTDRLADRDTIESDSTRLALPLILSYTVPLLAVVLVSALALVTAVIAVFAREIAPVQDALLWAVGRVGEDDVQFVWHVLVSLLALIAAVWLARRGQQAGALFLGILGILDLKSRLSADGRPLEILLAAGPGNRVEVWWVVLFAGLGVYWLLRRQLTPERASALAFLTLITLLLKQTDFIDNKFSPFFDSGGLGFIAFGIVWDALTIGAWANVGTRALPRVSRIFLYLGYVLMTVTVINWAASSHDLESIGRLTGDLGLVGLDAFGKPMLYAIFAVTLAGAFRGAGVTDLAEAPAEAPASGGTGPDDAPPPAEPPPRTTS